jgi:hypothetical protein
MKRVLFGVIWCVVLYFAVCIFMGAVAGGIAGSRDPANAAANGREAGRRVVAATRGYIFAGSIVVSVLGAWTGFLPGTRKNPPAKDQQ